MDNSIPFVPKVGGSSTWSQIGKEGILLDLALLKGTSIDNVAQTVTVQAGVLTKEIHEAVAKEGFCVSKYG